MQELKRVVNIGSNNSTVKPTVTLTLNDEGRVIISNTDNVYATDPMVGIHRSEINPYELEVLDALDAEISEWM